MILLPSSAIPMAAALLAGYALFVTFALFYVRRREQEQVRSRKEFVSFTSHQLLTPVSATKGFLSMLLEGDLGDIPEKQKDFLGKLYTLNQRMIEMIEDMLNLSRLEAGTAETAAETIELDEFLRQDIEEFAPVAAAKGIAVTRAVSKDVPTVKASSRLLRIVTQSLLSNAIKYTPDGGKVTVAATLAEDGGRRAVRIAVTDTGYGIPDADKPKMFTKFHRAENVKLKGTSGTGLGLFVTKQAVELLRGRIWFESKEEEGTAFFVDVPLA